MIAFNYDRPNAPIEFEGGRIFVHQNEDDTLPTFSITIDVSELARQGAIGGNDDIKKSAIEAAHTAAQNLSTRIQERLGEYYDPTGESFSPEEGATSLIFSFDIKPLSGNGNVMEIKYMIRDELGLEHPPSRSAVDKSDKTSATTLSRF